MVDLEVYLSRDHKSFKKGFKAKLSGELIILSGVNGSGKSQLLEMIYGRDGKNRHVKISSVTKLNGVKLGVEDIDFRSFRDNISIPPISESTSASYLRSGNEAWRQYNANRLNPADRKVGKASKSCSFAKKLLLEHFGEEKFNGKSIPEDEFKQLLLNSKFVWKQDDNFSNVIGEIFFNHAVKVKDKMVDVGRKNFEASMVERAPWLELNDLFKELSLDYRFKKNFELNGVEINEQPKLFAIDETGEINEENKRELDHLSDGEKAIISLCFDSLSGSFSHPKKMLLLDEVDSVLNPSLIKNFFRVLEKYYIEKDILVLMATHNIASISIAPEFANYYEVFKRRHSEERLLEVSRDEYSEMRIANESFYERIEDQKSRIAQLESNIDSEEDILIITEGKTDWRYMVSALKFFHEKGEFQEIKPEYFYRYGSREDVTYAVCSTEVEQELSESKLRNYLNSLVSSRTIEKNEFNKTRIGIFDSDTNAKIILKPELGVISFKIEPDGISTEFLFTETEIKTEKAGRRLFLGSEFNKRTKIHETQPELSLGGDSQNLNKAGEQVIIEKDVYNRNQVNMALSKHEFSKAVYDEEVKIEAKSWERFKHICTKISEFINKDDKD